MATRECSSLLFEDFVVSPDILQTTMDSSELGKENEHNRSAQSCSRLNFNENFKKHRPIFIPLRLYRDNYFYYEHAFPKLFVIDVLKILKLFWSTVQVVCFKLSGLVNVAGYF